MTTTYRRQTLNCDPQPMADGTFGPRLVVTEHTGEAAIDHVIDLGTDTYRTAAEASQAAVTAGMRWVDEKRGPIFRSGEFGYEVFASSLGDEGWTGQVRMYGSSSDHAIFDRRTTYMSCPGTFRDDGKARDAAKAHAIKLINAGANFEWSAE